MKDALGNEIIIRNTYGVARCTGGQNTIKLGVVEKLTPFGFALLKIKKSFISDSLDQPLKIEVGRITRVKVKPFMLFPINL